ncbi:MAG: crAss001_48 related protein [Bacilli bacterium]
MNITHGQIADMLVSTDYKVRMIAEYLELDDRTEKLAAFIEKMINDELPFTPKTKLKTYQYQYQAMVAYRSNLAIRCYDEGIDLSQYLPVNSVSAV